MRLWAWHLAVFGIMLFLVSVEVICYRQDFLMKRLDELEEPCWFGLLSRTIQAADTSGNPTKGWLFGIGFQEARWRQLNRLPLRTSPNWPTC
jgi:hypothetical protein